MIKNPPIIKEVVKKMGGKIEEVIPERGYFYVEIKGKKFLVTRKFKIARNFIVGGETTKYKDLTFLLLRRHSLPTPNTVCFYKSFSNRELDEKLHNLKYPLIIKDAEGSTSKGIFPNINNIEDAKRIIKKEIRNFPRLLAQEMVFGKEYRLTVLGDKIIGALRLIPPRVFGNGKDIIKKLITIKQKKTRRKTPFDSNLNRVLKEQGYNLKTILKKDEMAYLRNNSCLDEGGETEDVTDKVHKKIKNIAIQASKAVGKYLVGIDIICDDISKDPQKQNFNIIEINGKPDIYLHYNPTRGRTRNVVRDIINFILRLKNIE